MKNKLVRLLFSLFWIVWLPLVVVAGLYLIVMAKVYETLTPDSEKEQNASPQAANPSPAAEGKPPTEVR